MLNTFIDRRATDHFDRVYWKKYELNFKLPSGTSRGILTTKESWFFVAENKDWKYPAVGECSVIRGLNPDPMDQFEHVLDQCCLWLKNQGELPDLSSFPSISFGLEMLMKDAENSGSKVFFPSTFTDGETELLTNGLIWMGDTEWMKKQVIEKIKTGFGCIKLKVGAADFATELKFLKWIRTEFKTENPTLRVDANGAFGADDALEKLKRLSDFNLHSIEQPIAAGQRAAMAELCGLSPVEIALDEELIGLREPAEISALLSEIQPKYIILKPSLIGGWASSDAFISIAESMGIGWWMTSALESNVGLNAIAQYTWAKNVTLPQGLGTGTLYTNNIESPLYIHGQFLTLKNDRVWNLNPLLR